MAHKSVSVTIKADRLKAMVAEYTQVLRDFVPDNEHEEILLLYAQNHRKKLLKKLVDEREMNSLKWDVIEARMFVQFWTCCGIAFYDPDFAGVVINELVGKLDSKTVRQIW